MHVLNKVLVEGWLLPLPSGGRIIIIIVFRVVLVGIWARYWARKLRGIGVAPKVWYGTFLRTGDADV